MNKPIIAIIANGLAPSKKLLAQTLTNVDIIVAADGGAETCRELDIQPDFIVGDLDSVSEETKRYFKDASVILMYDQNYSDMQKAIAFSLSKDPEKLKIYSAFGKRSDHTFSNLLIFSGMDIPVPFELYDNFGILSLLHPGQHKLKGNAGEPVSLFSITPLQNLSINGLKYPVSRQNFKSFFNGSSNQFTEEDASVEFDSGHLFVYLPFKEEL